GSDLLLVRSVEILPRTQSRAGSGRADHRAIDARIHRSEGIARGPRNLGVPDRPGTDLRGLSSRRTATPGLPDARDPDSRRALPRPGIRPDPLRPDPGG